MFPEHPGAIVTSAQPAVLPHTDFSAHGCFIGMRDFFPGQEEFYKEEDFDILKLVFHKPCPSINPQNQELTSAVSGVFFEAQTMIGLLPYAIIELSITATT